MRVEYICHACLLIDTGGARIVTDPWFTGPAYCNQWFLFPKPVNPDGPASADVAVITHGHEDHLHRESLKMLPKHIRVLYPYYWYGGIKPYMTSLGFTTVDEVFNFKTVRVGDSAKVTFISNYLDSIVVVEGDGRVLVDVNDALHANHPNVIDIFVRAIRRRWPKIDTVFSGFGGANYFPNNVHVPGKDDETIARLREQLFVHNWCRIVSGLEPQVAVPFAADFALLDPEKAWINRVRFPREQVAAYYHDHFGGRGQDPAIFPMYPGDILEDHQLLEASPYRSRQREDGLVHLIEEQYATEIEHKKSAVCVTESKAEALVAEMVSCLRDRMSMVDPAVLRALRFSVRLKDVEGKNHYNIWFDGDSPRVARDVTPLAGCSMIVDTSSRILRYSFASDWGGDAIMIGYGCEFHLIDDDAVRRKLDRVCISLLTRLPSAKRHMVRKEPLRAAQYVLRNPVTRKWVGAYLKGKSKQSAIYDRHLWLSRTKCEICEVCDIPLLSDEFSSRLRT